MKPSLVLVSGLLSNEALWEKVRLEDIADIRVISPTDDSPEKMVQSILKAAPQKFYLAGHSMGGWLALEVMRHAPSRVEKLLLLNTTARSDLPEKAFRRRAMIEQAQNGNFNQVIESILEVFVYNEDAKEAVKKMFLAVGKEAFINQETAMLKRLETMSILPTITCKTAVAYAEHDKVFSFEEHQELARLIPGATLWQIKGSGHMSPMEQPEAVCEIFKQWII